MVTRMHVERLPNGYIRVFDRELQDTHLVQVVRSEVPNYFAGRPPVVHWAVVSQHRGYKLPKRVQEAALAFCQAWEARR